MIGKIVKIITGGAAAATLMMGATAAPSSAWVAPGATTVKPAQGGTWKYGFWNAALRSDYTVNKCHGSTVYKMIDGKRVKQNKTVDIAPGVTSRAYVRTVNSPGLKGQYFYRTC